jgi:hypothetical protein
VKHTKSELRAFNTNAFFVTGLFVCSHILAACGPMPQRSQTSSSLRTNPARTIAQDPVVRVGAIEKQLAAKGLDFEVRMKASFGEPAWSATWTEASYANFDKSKTDLTPIRGLLVTFVREAEVALKTLPADATVAAPETALDEVKEPVAATSARARLQAQLDLVQTTLRNLNQFTQPMNTDIDTAAIALDRGQGQD